MTIAAGLLALCSPAVADPALAATAPRTLIVRPGVGIGRVRVGETVATLRRQYPHVAVLNRGTVYRARVDGGVLEGGLAAGRVRGVISNSPRLVLDGERLENDETSESQRLTHAGWSISRCLDPHLLVYRRTPRAGRFTSVVWTNGRALALVTPELPDAWIHCTGTGHAQVDTSRLLPTPRR